MKTAALFLSALLLPGTARAQTAFEGRLGLIREQAAAAAARAFSEFRLKWDGNKYVCKDISGRTGLNPASPQEVLESRRGECADLRGADFPRADFQGADLRGADFTGARLKGADFRGADLLAARLDGAQLANADFRGARLAQAGLVRAGMRWVLLEGSDLTGARLRKADLTGTDLRSAPLKGVDLQEAVLHKADLAGADLSETNLRETDLSWAKLAGARLEGADLSHAILSDADLTRARLGQAALARTRLLRVRGRYAIFSSAVLRGADLREAQLDGADFAYANLRDADLRRAALGSANLRGADLRKALYDKRTVLPISERLARERGMIRESPAAPSTLAPTAASPVRFDKPMYAWTDRVRIRIAAPAWNSSPHRPDVIGAQRDGGIKISTRKRSLAPYRFVETGPDTGVFAAEILLTGFALDADGDGRQDTSPRTSGSGPADGMIENKGNDVLTVSWRYTDERTLTASAPISMGRGALIFDADAYGIGETATVRLADRDMNLNPDVPDRAPVHLYSDSDLAGVLLYAAETAADSGIFQASVSLTSSAPSNRGRLHARPGDHIHAAYTDRTLPPPADQERITVRAKVR